MVDRILRAIDPRAGQRVVEIGPGQGALTVPLVNVLGALTVIEIDRDLVRELRSRFGPDQVTVHEGDVLAFGFAGLGGDLRVVGNLPYNISTPILFALTAQVQAVRDCHFMLQREVVRRICAPAGSPDYGRLSVMLQYRWRTEALFDVPPTAFRPAPKVWSSLVRLVPHATLPWPASDEAVFAKTVAAAFGQRRKTLRNALAKLCSGDELVRLGIDPSSRAEELGVAGFVTIANFLAKRRQGSPPGQTLRWPAVCRAPRTVNR